MNYAIMSFGGFLSIGEKFHPLLWPLLDYDPEREGFTVPLDPSILKDALIYSAEQLRNLGDQSIAPMAIASTAIISPYGMAHIW